MAKNKIQIDIEANSRGAIEQLKATQSNINKVADTVAKLEANGTAFNKMNQSVMGFNALVERLANSMYTAGEATSFSEAQMKVLQNALSSVDKVYKGDFSKIADHIRAMSAEAERGTLSIKNLMEDEEELNRVLELEEKHLASLTEMWAVFDGTAEKAASGLLDSEALQDQFAYLEAIGDKTGILKMQYDALSVAVKQYIKDLREGNIDTELAEANSKNLTKEMQSLQKQMNNKGFSGFLEKFGKMVYQIVVFRTVMKLFNTAGRVFRETIEGGIKTAGEAEQVFSKLTTVFGEYTDAMERANGLAESIGVSSMTAASALSTVGDLLQAQGANTVDSLEMATEWVEKFNDIIAFKDIDMSLEEFAQNFMSGAAGNLRNFRTFGSIVKESAVNARLASQGLDQLTGSELELAKMTARAEIALEQQANAMGATQREWDTMLSAQRRYNEAQKEFKENVGETLKPVVNWWTNLKTSILDALNAQMAYDRYMKTGSVTGEGFMPNATDVEKWTALTNNGSILSLNSFNSQGGEIKAQVQRVLAAYGMDVTEALRLFDKFSSNSEARAALKAIAEERDRLVDLDKASKATAKSLLTLAENTDAFFESMMTLDGVDFTDSEWYKRLSAVISGIENGNITSGYDNAFSRGIELSVGEALTGIKGRGFSVTQLLFGEDDEGELLQSKVDEYRQYYDMLLSAQAKGMDVTQKQLDSVYNGWVSATEELKAYNDELERQQSLANAISSMQSIGAGYRQNLSIALAARDLGSTGMSSDLANAIASAKYQFTRDSLGLAKNSDEYITLKNAYNESIQAIYAWFEDVEKLAKAEAEKARKDAVLNARTGFIGGTDDLRFQTFTIGMDDLNVALWEASRSFLELVNSVDMTDEEYQEAYADYEEYLEVIKDYHKKLEEWEKEQEMLQIREGLKNDLYGATTIGSAISTFTDEKGDVWTDLATVIIDLCEKCEEWANILNVIDQYLDPLLDAIGYTLDAISRILIPVLNVLLPIVKAVATGLAQIAGFVDIAWTAVESFIKKAVGTLVSGFYDIRDAITDIHFGSWYPFGDNKSRPDWVEEWANTDIGANVGGAYDRMMTTLDGIWSETVAIDNNTKADYGTYADLRKRGMLSDADYLSLIGANKYSSSTTRGSATMTTSGYGNTTYITMNGLTIKTDIDSPERLVEYLENLDRGVVGY